MEKLYTEQQQATPFFEEEQECLAFNPSLAQFPEYSGLRSYHAKRSYVEETMIGLVSDNSLRLTDLLANWSDIRDVAGDVILGLTRDQSSGNQEPCPVPFELQNAKILVRSLTGKEIKWYDGQRSNRKLSPDPKVDAYMRKIGRSVSEKRSYRTDSEEAYLPLRQAWKSLKQNGLHVKWSESKLRKEVNFPLEKRRQILAEVPQSENKSVRVQETGEKTKVVRRGNKKPSTD